MKPTPRRCALYTRKSSEEGLDQSFNSLDAQREACAAFVLSQAQEGWRALDAHYDDGGFSGGSMERPGLKALLSDIEAGKIDVVVVYKIDRLTRSLADFARIVELFDRHGVSFVSVTQQFNTTSSMGRLTLNVLLSFAQFEREVTGERIRDKIAASKAKGMWMGGTLPLGYDLPADGARALVVNETEAVTVRAIFARYLELSSVHALQRELDEQGIRSKLRVSRSGRASGGQPFSRGALFHLLRNKTYLGLIVHKDRTHPGMHPAIVDTDLFEAVQARLSAQARRSGATGTGTRAPLTGRIFDADGQPMSPTTAIGSSGRRYRYYVSAPLQQGVRQSRTDMIQRVPAPAIEDMLAAIARRVTPEGGGLDPITRAEIHAHSLQLLMPVRYLPALRSRLEAGETIEVDPVLPSSLRLTVAIRMRLRGGRTRIEGAVGSATMRDPVLIRALRSAHALVATDRGGLPVIAASPASPYLRRLVRLAFLAPDLQRDILAGRRPAGLTLDRLLHGELPVEWAAQRAMIAGI